LPVDRSGPFGLTLLVAGALVAAGGLAAPLLAGSPKSAPAAPVGGPAADYPMVLGPAFVIDGTTYTPADTMNYDQVGYAAVDPDAPAGISMAHRTLPLPSYVEVTSLKTGRTILVRALRRGPMSGPEFVALSAGAAAQLGAGGRTPVRVRRVNPPEVERALLRAGQSAPARMDTPMSLVGVLQRKLVPPLAPVSAPATADPSVVAAPAMPASATPGPAGKPAPALKAPATKPAVAAAPRAAEPAAPAPRGPFTVQVGAFSTRERAELAARQVGGTVAPAGKLFRVRIGGFAGPAQAAGALAKARRAGYSDARIQRAD